MNKISNGLFGFRGLSWWRNIKNIPIFFKRAAFTLKHGYAPQAQWDTFSWFIAVMREVLDFYATRRMGDIPIDGVPESQWTEYNDKLFKDMRALLDVMDESHYEEAETLEERKKFHQESIDAKNEFFNLFSNYFYDLWD